MDDPRSAGPSWLGASRSNARLVDPLLLPSPPRARQYPVAAAGEQPSAALPALVSPIAPGSPAEVPRSPFSIIAQLDVATKRPRHDAALGVDNCLEAGPEPSLISDTSGSCDKQQQQQEQDAARGTPETSELSMEDVEVSGAPAPGPPPPAQLVRAPAPGPPPELLDMFPEDANPDAMFAKAKPLFEQVLGAASAEYQGAFREHWDLQFANYSKEMHNEHANFSKLWLSNNDMELRSFANVQREVEALVARKTGAAARSATLDVGIAALEHVLAHVSAPPAHATRELVRDSLRLLQQAHRAFSKEIDARLTKMILDGGSLCVVCLSHTRETLFRPCGHVAMCQGCVFTLQKMPRFECPNCRCKIEGVETVYLS